MSVMEMSHRSKTFTEINESAQNGIRELLNVPENYRILFLQGGATLQFSMIPMNFLKQNEVADYIVTGVWGEKAVKAAKLCGNVNTVYSTAENGFNKKVEDLDAVYENSDVIDRSFPLSSSLFPPAS